MYQPDLTALNQALGNDQQPDQQPDDQPPGAPAPAEEQKAPEPAPQPQFTGATETLIHPQGFPTQVKTELVESFLSQGFKRPE